MPSSASTLKFFRLSHRYIGLFISPALMFFALTGALQTFSLHETTQGSSYKPAGWIMTLAQIHKKQTDTVPVKKPRPVDKPTDQKSDKATDQKPGATPSAPQAAPKSHLPMKIFFLLVAIGLFTSTLTGIYMSYRYGGSKIVVTVLLIAGIVMPPLLLKF